MNSINVCSPSFDTADSYGRIASELTTHLTRRGVHVNTFAFDESAPDTRLVPSPVSIMMGYPTAFDVEPGHPAVARLGKRIIISMFESTALPDGWVETLNRADLVVVPSTFVRQLFIDSGVTVPVVIIPLGVGEAYRYKPRKWHKVFTVCAIADRGQRKGWHRAIFAFNNAFGDDMSVRLVLKTRARGLPFDLLNPNVTVLAEDMSERALAAFYARCDVMLFPSAGEGFGLPCREFAATGGIVLATDWSGTADDLPAWGIPVPVTGFVTAWQNQVESKLSGIGQWAEPDMAFMTDWLKRLRAADVGFRNKLGYLAAQNARRLYRWDVFAEQVFRLAQTLELTYRHETTGVKHGDRDRAPVFA